MIFQKITLISVIIGWIFMHSSSRNHRIRDKFTCLTLLSLSFTHFLYKNIIIIIISIFSRVILLNQLNPLHLAINARQNNRLQCQHCQQRLSKEWAVLEVSNVPSSNLRIFFLYYIVLSWGLFFYLVMSADQFHF